MYEVCQLILVVFRCLSYKVLGRGITNAIYTISEDSFLLCIELSDRRVWYGTWVMLTSGLLSLISNRTVIEYGVRSDMLCRHILYVTGLDTESNLPPYYACMKVINQSVNLGRRCKPSL